MNAKNVLVTGADGFIGSHLVETLVKSGYNVRALSIYNSANDWGWLEDVDCKNDIEIVSGDVRDPFLCNSITRGIDTVFNLAALIAIPYSYVAPASYIDTNVNGCLNVCQAALSNNVSKVIQISTSEVYGTAKYVPIDELHPLQPQSPYSASKIGADALAMSYYNSFELPVTIARPFNTYGPRQSARAFIPTIISQLLSGMKEIKLGDPTPTRDLNFVLDTCKGLILLSENDKCIGQTINIGSNTEYSVGQVFEMVKEIMNVDACYVEDKSRIRPAGSEVMRLVCDNSKIKELTGFTSEYSISQGLEEVIKWMSLPKNLKKYKPDIYNI